MPDAFHSHYLPNLSVDQIEALDKSATIILPIGAIEQHGPHLPVGTDALLGEAWLNFAFEALSTPLPFYVAPPIHISNSVEHFGFPGTLSTTSKVLHDVIGAMASQIVEWDFRSLILFNTHGGNAAVCEQLAEELTEFMGISTSNLYWYYIPEELNERTKQYDQHAGEIETSLLYAYLNHPEIPEKADACWVDQPTKTQYFSKKGATATWLTRDISATGTLGDATQASREKGATWLCQGGALLAEKLQAIHATHTEN